MSVQAATKIFKAGVEAVMPHRVISKMITRGDGFLQVSDIQVELKENARLFVLGAGKAAALMAKAVEEQLGDLISGGIVIVKYGHHLPLKRIHVTEAAHPLPDEQGLMATDRLMQYTRDLTENDVVLFLLSGGASSLMVDAPYGISLEALQNLFSGLLRSGADISEMNCVRKHFSQIKGGGIARAVYPATLISLILSDVPHDDLEIIGSGPTVADRTCFKDVRAILDKYSLWIRLSGSVRDVVEQGMMGTIPETVKPGDPVMKRCVSFLIANNRQALDAGAAQASAMGYTPICYDQPLQGEAVEKGRQLAEVLNNISSTQPLCILIGGETTVTVTGKGKGGRCQELALSAATILKKSRGVTLLAAGTDGADGPTDAAGACIDSVLLEKISKEKLDTESFTRNNDSYNFFEKNGGHVKTGPTLTNVMDMIVILIDPVTQPESL